MLAQQVDKLVQDRAELRAALAEMLDAFSMSGALDVNGMKRRTDAKKRARDALEKTKPRNK